jgi:hypothetical protein
MSSDDNSDNSSESSNDSSQDTSSEAAGVVRGLARSIQGMIRHPGVGSLPRRPVLKELKNMFRFPGVGSLPRQTAVLKRRLPVQRVASVSDRLSTGIDLFQTAVEQQIEEASRLKRVTTFVKSLVKNTLLGAAVFETYEYMVTYLAPPEQSCQQMNNKNDHNDLVDDDVYARASLQSHFLAGACGGLVHAIPSTFWEPQQPSSNVVIMSSSRALSQCYYLSAMIIHHSIAHSLLFGCYESVKREFVLRDKQQQQQFRHDEIPYFASVSMAGGLAGQIQHVISHYTEQWLLLVRAENTTTAAPSSSRLVIQLLPRVVSASSPPTLRPTLFAFFPILK